MIPPFRFCAERSQLKGPIRFCPLAEWQQPRTRRERQSGPVVGGSIAFGPVSAGIERVINATWRRRSDYLRQISRSCNGRPRIAGGERQRPILAQGGKGGAANYHESGDNEKDPASSKLTENGYPALVCPHKYHLGS